MEIDLDAFAEQVNYMGLLGKLVVPRTFAFVEQSILFTGEDPYSAEELSSLLPERADCYMDSEVPEDVSFDLVVVWQTAFSEARCVGIHPGFIKNSSLFVCMYHAGSVEKYKLC